MDDMPDQRPPRRYGLRRRHDERPTTLTRLIERMLPARASADFPVRPNGNGKLVVATYNVHKCVGTDGRFDPERIAAVIAEIDPDVITLQEADRRIGLRQGLLDLDAIERATGLALVPLAERPLSHGWHGNAVLARKARTIRTRRITLPYAEPRGAVMAELDLPAGRLRVLGAHLGLLRHSRRRQTATLLRALDRAEPMPTILMGDFNEWRAGRPDCPLAELEPFFGQTLQDLPSFPARRPIFALDRILGWPSGTIEAIAVHETPLSRIASDHLPLKAIVDLDAPLPGGGPAD